MSQYIEKRPFQSIDLNDPFFDSLKEDYAEFHEWFRKKEEEEAYVLYVDGSIAGFMYLKVEEGEAGDVQPPLPSEKRIKIGTLKVTAHGTRLGERFIKKAIDHALTENANEIYVTVFAKHAPLINLLEEFGFAARGTKTTEDGEESVLVKTLGTITGNLRQDYPMIDSKGSRKFLLSIYPQWHTRLFPDSILNTESYDVVNDVSHTNSIQKTYVCFMDLAPLRSGDILVIYRTSDQPGRAWYRSVISSVCVVEEVKSKADFGNVEEYIQYTEPFSVFTRDELIPWWNRGRLFVIKMLYSAAFAKRLIRKDLVEHIGLNPAAYWGFLELNDPQFAAILHGGSVDERVIIY